MSNTGLKNELFQLMSGSAQNQLEEFIELGYDMDTDKDLFECINNNWKREFQRSDVVTGKTARSKLSAGHYTIRYIGPNPTPKVQEMAEVLTRQAEKSKAGVAATKTAIEKMRQELGGEVKVEPKDVKVVTRAPKAATIE